MKYYKTLKEGKITELSKSDSNFTAATEQIQREEYDSLMLGVRIFLNRENEQKVKTDLNGDGYYDI